MTTTPQLSLEYIESTAIHNGEQVNIPLYRIGAGLPGPVLVLTAAQHGRELNGVEALRRIIDWAPTQVLRGELRVLPVVNPPALANVRQVVPGDSQNINRIWPGDVNGTATERIAAAVAPHVASADYLIDLHGWSDWTVGALLASHTGGQAVRDLARAFGCVYNYFNTNGFQPGNLKTFAEKNGVIAIGAELTPQWRVNEASVQAGVQGIQNAMVHIGMTDGEIHLPTQQWIYDTHTRYEELWAEQCGMYVQEVEIGTMVSAGDRLGRFYPLNDITKERNILAPISGLVVNNGPCRRDVHVESNVVAEGALLAQVWEAEPFEAPMAQAS